MREAVATVGKDEPVDMVKMGVGEGNSAYPVDGDLRLAHRLGQMPHCRVPGVRSPCVDQRDFVAVIDGKGVDG